MVVIPLVATALFAGIAGLGDLRRVGRLGVRTLGFFWGTTLAAILIGFVVAALLLPLAPITPKQEAALRQAVQAANLRVYNLAHGSNADLLHMQTTLTAAVIAGPVAYLAHAGDSRAYLLRGDRLTQLTGDHSEAAELLRLRLITAEQARGHPRRSVLTRTLGSNLLLRPDFARQPLEPGDRLLLCSDGLWGEVADDDLLRAAQLPPEVACDQLVSLACDHGGGDNITVQLVHALELDPAPPAPTGRIARLLSGLRGG